MDDVDDLDEPWIKDPDSAVSKAVLNVTTITESVHRASQVSQFPRIYDMAFGHRQTPRCS